MVRRLVFRWIGLIFDWRAFKRASNESMSERMREVRREVLLIVSW